jgi:hypothetical protein
MTQNVLTNNEAVTGSKHFFRLFLLLLKGRLQTSGVLLSPFQYQPTLLYISLYTFIYTFSLSYITGQQAAEWTPGHRCHHTANTVAAGVHCGHSSHVKIVVQQASFESATS